jgi:hypothetical protein
VGSPVSKTNTGEWHSAKTTPRNSMRRVRVERSASTRVYGLRGWTKICASSFSHVAGSRGSILARPASFPVVNTCTLPGWRRSPTCSPNRPAGPNWVSAVPFSSTSTAASMSASGT